jgi:hypothetical protein
MKLVPGWQKPVLFASAPVFGAQPGRYSRFTATFQYSLRVAFAGTNSGSFCVGYFLL